MPVEHQYTIKAGSRNQLLLLFAAETDHPARGMRGLVPGMAGLTAGYLRAGAGSAERIELLPGTLGVWAPGGLTEVDATLMPGVYQLGAPDPMLATGADRVLLLLRAPGARIAPIEISLVAYDPQDSERIGVTSLANDERHKFLRRAMPRLTEMELALGAAAEGELRKSLRAEAEEAR